MGIKSVSSVKTLTCEKALNILAKSSFDFGAISLAPLILVLG
jgi:hypothetical protein